MFVAPSLPPILSAVLSVRSVPQVGHYIGSKLLLNAGSILLYETGYPRNLSLKFDIESARLLHFV